MVQLTPPIPIRTEDGFSHSASAYKSGDCRCDVCKAEWASAMRIYRRQAGAQARPEDWGEQIKNHGTRSRYKGSRTVKPCRCEECRRANREYSREAYAAKQAAAAEEQ